MNCRVLKRDMELAMLDTLVEKCRAAGIEDWDSLEHITLISAVERTFCMKFKMGEISSMRNVGEMVSIIQARIKL